MEEVKSFWHLIQIPICHLLNTGNFSFIVLGYQYRPCQKSTEMNQSSIFEIIVLVNNDVLSEAVAVISLLFCLLFIVAFCPKFIPSILQRIWIGLFFFLLLSLSAMATSFNVTANLVPVEQSGSFPLNNTSDKLWPYYVFIVPKFLSGLGLMFNRTGQLEFILTQVPHSMQSLFIGALHVQFIFLDVSNAVGTATSVGRYWQFYVVLSCLQLIIIVTFTIIKHRYKYRQCNNDSDIHIREH